jgi:hypothetical protein
LGLLVERRRISISWTQGGSEVFWRSLLGWVVLDEFAIRLTAGKPSKTGRIFPLQVIK